MHSLSFGELLKNVFVVWLLRISTITLASTLTTRASSEFTCPTGIFNFGTSLTDTGNVAFSFPGAFRSERLPYGENFFGRNAFRFSDGRVVVDFLDQAFGYPLMTPYLQSIAPNFRRGVNFAASGATALADASQVPFDLNYQVAQFLRFRQSTIAANQVPDLEYLNENLLPHKSTFTEGLYILSFGRNDFSHAYSQRGYTPASAITFLVPQIVQSIVGGIKTLYDDGARQFLVFNVPPQGCSPQYLASFGPLASDTDYDKYGCLAPFNKVNQAFNNQLRVAVQELRDTLSSSFIMYFDYYSANIAVLDDPQSFGIESKTFLQACCGVGENYNYNALVLCSYTSTINGTTLEAKPCSNPSEYINWDGIHFTDTFNRITTEFVLSGEFLDPPINLKDMCKLDFSKFVGVNYTEAYPQGYLISPPSSAGASLDLRLSFRTSKDFIISQDQTPEVLQLFSTYY